MLSDEESGGSSGEAAPAGAAAAAPEPPAEPAGRRWASDLRALSDELQALASRAPAVTGFGASTRSVALGTELSGPGLAEHEAVAARLGALRGEARAIAQEAAAVGAEAEVVGASGIRWVQAAARAASGAARAESGRLVRHRQAAAALEEAASSVTAARSEVWAAAEDVRRRASAGERALQGLRADVAATVEAAGRAKRELQHELLAEQRVRDLPRVRVQCSLVEQRTVETEAECEVLRRNAEQLRAGLEAPTSASTKAEALEVRLASVDRECRELQSCLSAGASSGSARGVPPLAAALTSAQEQNRRLASEVRDARAVRDEVAERQPLVQAELTAAQWQSQELAQREAYLREREADVQHEVLQYRAEISELELSMDTMQCILTEAPEHSSEVERAQQEELEACRQAMEEDRRALRQVEEMADAKEQEFEDRSERLKAQQLPHGALRGCLYSAKSKAAKARGPWARSAMR